MTGKVQVPLAATVVLPTGLPPLVTVTVSPAIPVPLMTGVALLVNPPDGMIPVDVLMTNATGEGGAGGVGGVGGGV